MKVLEEYTKMIEKKVSIVVPVYNAELYLDKCLESIKNQTYQNWEAIIVNDGSTDRSNDIIEKWCKKDDRYVHINQKNMGPGAARNKGIEYAIEKNYDGYITFIDADDYWKKDGIKSLLEPFLSENVDISWAEFEIVKLDKNNKYIHICDGDIISKDEILTGRQILEYDEQEKYIKMTWRIYYGLMWAKMFRVKDWEDIRVPEDMIVSEDMAVTHRIIYNAQKVKMLTKQVMCYQMTPNSLSKINQKKARKFCEDQIKAQWMRINFYEHENEKKLTYLAYVGLAEEYLNNILHSKTDLTYQKKMIEGYNKIVKKLLKAPVSYKRKLRYILYRFFMKSMFISRH